MVNYITIRFAQAMITDNTEFFAENFVVVAEESPLDIVSADWQNNMTVELATTTTGEPGDWIKLIYTKPGALTHALITADGRYYDSFEVTNE